MALRSQRGRPTDLFANRSSHLDFVVIWSALPAHIRGSVRPVAGRDYWERGTIPPLACRACLPCRPRRSRTGSICRIFVAVAAFAAFTILAQTQTRPAPTPTTVAIIDSSAFSDEKAGITRVMVAMQQIEAKLYRCAMSYAVCETVSHNEI